jgi:hypothetical protein
MKPRERRVDEGVTPRGAAITREIDKNRKFAPKTYVEFAKRKTMGPTQGHLPFFNQTRSKRPVTLPKLTCTSVPPDEKQ